MCCCILPFDPAKHAIPKILSGRLNYYITRWRQEVSSLENSWWEDVGMRTCPREAGPPRPQLSNPGERERHTAMSGGAGEVNMLLFCSVSNSLSHINLSNKLRGIFFYELCLYYCVNMYSACLCVYMRIYFVAIQHVCVCVCVAENQLYGILKFCSMHLMFPCKSIRNIIFEAVCGLRTITLPTEDFLFFLSFLSWGGLIKFSSSFNQQFFLLLIRRLLLITVAR